MLFTDTIFSFLFVKYGSVLFSAKTDGVVLACLKTSALEQEALVNEWLFMVVFYGWASFTGRKLQLHIQKKAFLARYYIF